MLFHHFDFDDPSAIKNLRLQIAEHSATWEFYLESYNYVVYKIFEKGLTRNYEFNCRAKAIMFLIRHTFELCLKYNLNKTGQDIPFTHDLEELIDAVKPAERISPDFRIAVCMMNSDPDGAAYRYFKGYDNKPYFNNGERYELGKVIEFCNRGFSTDQFYLPLLFPETDYRKRSTWWALTFHLGESQQLAHVRSQYDLTLEFIIEGLITDGWDINKLYLPILFLIRHSLEIALKYNISEIQRFTSLIKDQDFSHEHSLARLFNVYNGFLNHLDISTLHSDTIKQMRNFQEKYSTLNEQIHILDSNSRQFRFPVDKISKSMSIELRRINLIEILKLYYYTDPFITFTNDVLEQSGLFVLRERAW